MIATKGKLAAIILAAGRSSRMKGSNKLLALFDGKTLIRQVAERTIASGFDEVLVVSGHEDEKIICSLNALPITFVYNSDYVTGLSSSLKKGVGALGEDVSAVMIILGDMPAIKTAHILHLIAAFSNSEEPVCVRANSNGRRGNPVILPREVFKEIKLLEGDVGAKFLIEKSPYPIIEVEIGKAADIDVDTPAALALAGGIAIQNN